MVGSNSSWSGPRFVNERCSSEPSSLVGALFSAEKISSFFSVTRSRMILRSLFGRLRHTRFLSLRTVRSKTLRYSGVLGLGYCASARLIGCKRRPACEIDLSLKSRNFRSANLRNLMFDFVRCLFFLGMSRSWALTRTWYTRSLLLLFSSSGKMSSGLRTRKSPPRSKFCRAAP